MIIGIIIVLVLFFLFSVTFKLTLCNFISFLALGFTDLIDFFRFKKFNILNTGEFLCFDASDSVCFGSGKTLSGVSKLYDLSNKYAGKKVFHNGKFTNQKIVILSNLNINIELFKNNDFIDFQKLNNMNEILYQLDKNIINSKEDGYLYKTLVFIDECQNSLHCRNFKNNLNPQLLKSLTECRHYNLSIFYTCPRFSQVDLLLRQSTSTVCHCKKIWRYQYHTYYMAVDLESGKDPEKIKHKRRRGFFVKNIYYNLYDTLEIVEEIEKGEYLPESEILALQGVQSEGKNFSLSINKKGIRAKKL